MNRILCLCAVMALCCGVAVAAKSGPGASPDVVVAAPSLKAALKQVEDRCRMRKGVAEIDDYRQFASVLKAFPEESMTYSFGSLGELLGISVLDSDDGVVRTLAWRYPTGGTMGVYGCCVLFRSGGKVRFTMLGEPDELDEGDPVMTYVLPVELYTLGGGYYLMGYLSRLWGNCVSFGIEAYVVRDGGFSPAAIFEAADGALCPAIGSAYDPYEWDEKGGGPQACIVNGRKTMILKPVTFENDMSQSSHTGRYIRYIWNGGRFVESGETGDPSLHYSLQDYAGLERMFKTSRNIVRIDRMGDGSYRYAAWKASGSIGDEPELVLGGGSYLPVGEEWVFRSGDFVYHCSPELLYIEKGGRRIGSWAVMKQ